MGGESESDEEEIQSSSNNYSTHQINKVKVISDEEANDIFLRMAAQSQARKGFIKKNWAEEETKLLKWAVITFTRQKSISV
jgi:hypothetical protein